MNTKYFTYDSDAEPVINGTTDSTEWLLCPVCKGKTRDKMREDTVLINFPLYCPKCKQETLINVQRFNITIINGLSL